MSTIVNKKCQCGCGRDVLRLQSSFLKGHGRRGRRNSMEHNAAISAANKGKRGAPAWNLGQRGLFHHTPETRQRISDTSKKSGVGKWMLGRTLPESVRAKVSKSNTGHACSEASREKIGQANGGSKNGMYGKLHNESSKNKISQVAGALWSDPEFVKRHQEYQKSDEWKEIARGCAAKAALVKEKTTIEIKIHDLLAALEIPHYQGYVINNIKHKYACDIFVPKWKLVIECDGDYWHCFPIGRPIDAIRNKELEAKGYLVLRLWEHEIKKMNADHLRSRIAEVVEKN